MDNIEELLHALKTIGDPVYEQHKKLHEDNLVTQERFVIDKSSALHDLDVHQINSFCKTFGFMCNITLVDEHLQVQFLKKEK